MALGPKEGSSPKCSGGESAGVSRREGERVYRVRSFPWERERGKSGVGVVLGEGDAGLGSGRRGEGAWKVSVAIARWEWVWFVERGEEGPGD